MNNYFLMGAVENSLAEKEHVQRLQSAGRYQYADNYSSMITSDLQQEKNKLTGTAILSRTGKPLIETRILGVLNQGISINRIFNIPYNKKLTQELNIFIFNEEHKLYIQAEKKGSIGDSVGEYKGTWSFINKLHHSMEFEEYYHQSPEDFLEFIKKEASNQTKYFTWLSISHTTSQTNSNSKKIIF